MATQLGEVVAMTDRGTKAIGFGVALVVVGLVLGWSGLAPLSEYWDADDGYFMSSPLTLDRASSAIVAEDVDLLRGRYDTLTEETFIFTFMGEPDEVRLQGVASTSDALFVGIAATVDADAYLDGVGHDEIVEWDSDQANITDVEYVTHEGTGIPDAPGAETFWVASVTGTGEQTLDWTIEPGDWTVVVMNADSSSGVTAELRFGTLVPAGLHVVAWTVLAVGLVALISGATLLVVGLRGRRRNTTPTGDVDDTNVALEPDTPREPVGPTS